MKKFSSQHLFSITEALASYLRTVVNEAENAWGI
jgi:hypothetical protein